jgi:sec-independent protein translocase protein TatB
MLGLGWTEMLVIGVVALIVIGPKDLPVVMNRVGKIVGQIRRMGSEFQREINKTTGLDEVRNLRNSITAPLKKTSDEIRREFNAMTPTGEKPTGVIKPGNPKVESVVDEIKAAAGMTPNPPLENAMTDERMTSGEPVKAVDAPTLAPAPTSPVLASDLPKLDPVPNPAESQPVTPPKPARKPRTPKVNTPADVPVLPTEPADSPATKPPRTRSPRKTAPAKAPNE